MKKYSLFLFLGVCFTVATESARAQAFVSEAESSSQVSGTLPDSPGAILQVQASPYQLRTDKPPQSKYHRIIPADKSALPLSAKDKFALSLIGPTSIEAFGSSLFSASMSDWRDTSPHYGVDLPAFGQRFGAAKLRQVTDSFFSYGLYASAFHEDPRYYVLGRGHKLKSRIIYSASRAVITRNDDGSTGANWSKLAGIVTATAITNAYYPERDRTAGRNISSCFTSVVTTAGVNELHEFIGDALHLVFHKHQGNSTK